MDRLLKGTKPCQQANRKPSEDVVADGERHRKVESGMGEDQFVASLLRSIYSTRTKPGTSEVKEKVNVGVSKNQGCLIWTQNNEMADVSTPEQDPPIYGNFSV